MIIIGNSNRARILTLWLIVVAAVATVSVNTGVASALPAMDHFHPAAQRPVVTSTSAVASNLGGTVMTIHGQHLSTASGALFGSVPGTNFHALSDSTAQVTAPAHTVGVLDLRVESFAGLSLQTVRDHVTYKTGSRRPTVGPAVLVDPTHIANLKISCPTTTFCGFAQADAMWTRSGSRDGPKVAAPPNVRVGAIGCPIENVCRVIGQDSHSGAVIAGVLSGGQWGFSRVTGQVRGGGDWAIACPTTSECWAVGTSSLPVHFHEGVWTLAKSGLTAGSISCPSTSFCVSTRDDQVVTLSNGSWSPHPLAGAFDLQSVDCVSTQFCVVVGSPGAWSYDGAQWRQTYDSPADGLYSVFCVTTTRCAITRFLDGIVEVDWDGANWTRVDHGLRTRASAASCVRGGSCTVAGGGDISVWDGSNWTGPTVFDHSRGDIDELACPAITLCVAKDRYDNVSFGRRGGWSTPTTSWDPHTANDAGEPCSVGSLCLTSVLRWDGSSWSEYPSVPDHPGFFSVDCPSTQFCYGLTRDSWLARFDGQSWSLVAQVPSPYRSSVPLLGCPVDGTCFYIGAQNRLLRLSETSWRVVGTVPDDRAEDLSCPSASFCAVATSTKGVARIWSAGTWSKLAVPTFAEIVCRTSNDCLLVDQSAVHQWDGVSVSDRIGTLDSPPTAVRTTPSGYVIALSSGRVLFAG